MGIPGAGLKGSGPAKKRLILLAGVLAALILVIAIAATSVLNSAGNYLAPRQLVNHADVVIIEGEELLQEGAVAEALRLMSDHGIKRMVLVTHTYGEGRMAFGISRRYGGIVAEELERVGIRKGDYILVTVPVAHPVTLTEARAVLDILSKESVKSAVLIARGFHTRRSLLVYQKIGRTKGIEVVPWSSSVGYPLTDWWRDEDAIYDFVAQLAKLGYYLFRGHISVTELFRTY